MKPAVAWLAALCLLSLAPAAHAAASYCSPTGDFCQGTYKKAGVRMISLTTFSFRGRVRVCVSHDGYRDCRRFLLHRLPGDADLYEIEVRWSRHFPNRGTGRYAVAFFWSGYRLGETVSFRFG